MIRRLLSSVADRTAYATPALIGRNIAKWWSRRGGWLINSLIMDECHTLRCMRALEPRQPVAPLRGGRLMWVVMDQEGGAA